MIRVLHIARATTPAANAKALALAREPGVSLWLVRPRDGGAADLRAAGGHLETVRFWRRPDPHRGLYGTVTFGLPAVSPHIVHAEEEPDSLAALQVAAARRLFAPSARLVLHTWQNVDRPARPHVRAVLRTSLRAADAVLCASATAAQLLRARGFERPVPVVLQAGVETEMFRPCHGPRLSEAFTVGYVGRLVPEKGLDTLVSAAARLDPPAVVAVAGSGPTRSALAAQAEREGFAGLRLLGRLAPADVARLLSGIDVLVLPSRTTPVWAEQFGRVLAEAMACGTPVVGSSSGEIPAVIGDAGLLFPEGDAPALAAVLGRLRDSPALRSEYASRGRARAEALFSAAALARDTAAFYRQLAAGGGATR